MSRIIQPHRMVLPATPAGAAEYALNYGWENASLHGESSRLLNVNGSLMGSPPQVGYPSVYQNLPADADTLLRWLGGGAYPAGFGLANVLAIYECDTASPLVDSLGLGPNLVAAGGPLTGRECVGLGQAGSWTSKVGVEFSPDATAAFFGDAGNAFGNVAEGAVFSFLLVLRFNSSAAFANGRIFSKEGGNLWTLAHIPGASTTLHATPAYTAATVAWPADDSSWHCLAGVLDSLALGAHTHSLLTDLGDATSAAYATVLTNATSLHLGAAVAPTNALQVAYLACFDRALTSAMRVAFWRHAQVPVPFAYARTNPLVAPIGASRVACYGAGQAAVGYDASLVSAVLGNGLGNGYVADAGETFEPIGSDNFPGNALDNIGNTHSTQDGASGMRDGVRSIQGGVWAVGGSTNYLGPIAIAGASNVPWWFASMYRQATVGTTARFGVLFVGDAGGPETFNLLADNAAPADWMRWGATCTPVGAGHIQHYDEFGAALLNDNCDWAELFVVKNRATAPLAWRRVGTAAAAATTTPSIQVVNTGNRYYNPLRGRARVTIGGFQGTSGAVFLDCAVAGTAGSMQFNYNAGQLILRIWDATPALVAAINCGAVNTARHTFIVMWDSFTPIRGAAAGGHMIVAENGVILGEGGAAWVAPTADVTPIAIGAAVGVTGAACCFIELEQLISDPGAVSLY